MAQDDSLYLIVKTEPDKLPANKRDAFTYNNKLQSRSDGTNWLDHNTASKTLYGSENIFKELGCVFTYPVPATPSRTSSLAQIRASAQAR